MQKKSTFAKVAAAALAAVFAIALTSFATLAASHYQMDIGGAGAKADALLDGELDF